LETTYVLTLLVFYSLSAATASGLVMALYGFSAARLLVLLGALASVVAVVSLGLWVEPSINVYENIARSVLARDRNQVMAAAFGVGIGLPWFGLLLSRDTMKPLAAWIASLLLIAGLAIPILAASVMAAKDALVSIAYATGIRSAAFARATDNSFAVELFAHLSAMPVRVCVADNEEIFVSTMQGPFAEISQVLRLKEDPSTGQVAQKVVAEMLNRPFGMVYKDGVLYVSRSGLHTKFDHGRMENVSTGAVTQLKDLDGDGVMDYYHDILTGLPGAQAPAYFHQNNGLAFAPDGSLYVTSGSPDERAHAVHPWEGTILKLDPELKNPEIFATGLRNPFAIAVLPNGDVIGTDQDTAWSDGDEINHYMAGKNYGHPSVIHDDTKAVGAEPPLHRGQAVYAGIAYTDSPNLPEKYHGIYVADWSGKRIVHGRLEKSGETYKVAISDFVKLNGAPGDIAITPSGTMYITCTDTQEVLRVRYTGGS
jgi:glucose/arabinose dehydrogenase